MEDHDSDDYSQDELMGDIEAMLLSPRQEHHEGSLAKVGAQAFLRVDLGQFAVLTSVRLMLIIMHWW